MTFVIYETTENSFVKFEHKNAAWKDSWPDKTDLWCWHCCHTFDTKPIPFPLKYDEKLQRFSVVGTFCSWNCAKAFKQNAGSFRRGIDENIFTLFYKRCTGTIKSIPAAPPKYLLDVFGGPLTIEEFRNKTAKDEKSFVSMPPNLILHAQLLHERKHSETLRHNLTVKADMNVTVDMGSKAAVNETLKLRRPKPVKSNQSMLERTLGLLKIDD